MTIFHFFTTVEDSQLCEDLKYIYISISLYFSLFFSDAAYDKACRADFLSLTCFCTEEYDGFIPAVRQTHRGLRVSGL